MSQKHSVSASLTYEMKKSARKDSVENDSLGIPSLEELSASIQSCMQKYGFVQALCSIWEVK